MVENCKDCDQKEFDRTFENHKPYVTLQNNSSGIVRRFPAQTESHLLKWHADESDRVVKPLFDTDWKFQFDNELPIDITEEYPIFIKEGRIHRLIKGNKDLVVHISEQVDIS
tara:strand:- start:43 stop:378 length:336 start_codon:yes stop_codon:yes gene_type:complete